MIDQITRLPHVREMGFDVLYFPPIHPIGSTARKGKNNAVSAAPGDVGSPWAIGAKEGGHKAIHPDLGSFEDFTSLVSEARKKGIRIALDIAFQCSPDHPYVYEHPEWFKQRPDGTVQFRHDVYGTDGRLTALLADRIERLRRSSEAAAVATTVGDAKDTKGAKGTKR